MAGATGFRSENRGRTFFIVVKCTDVKFATLTTFKSTVQWHDAHTPRCDCHPKLFHHAKHNLCVHETLTPPPAQPPGPGHPTPPPSPRTREFRTPTGHPSEDTQRQGDTLILGLEAETRTRDQVGTSPQVGQPADSSHLSHGMFDFVSLTRVQPGK